MTYNSKYYWKNFLEKDKETFVKPNSYVVNLHIVNQSTSDAFYKWHSFDTEEEVIGFIKFVALPSGYYSRIFGKEAGDLMIAADTYDSVLELLYNNIVRVDHTLIDNFKADYELLEEAEKDFNLDLLNDFCHSFNSHLNFKDIVFSGIEVYENIKEFGRQLVSDYEEQGMIEQLEIQMELSKDEIVELFSSIDDNPFMLRKINEFLNSKFLI
jgi:hypothetical protein